jgi:uncharacterized membrane protein
MGGAVYYVVIIVAILACVAFLVWNKKKQAGSAPNPSGGKGPQRGIIK